METAETINRAVVQRFCVETERQFEPDGQLDKDMAVADAQQRRIAPERARLSNGQYQRPDTRFGLLLENHPGL